MPVFNAAAFPLFGCRSTRTPGRPSSSTMSAVPSVEPSSTTRISTGWSLAAAERTVDSMPAASLYAGTTIDTGWVTGGPHRAPAARRARACRRAITTSNSSRSAVRAPTTINAHLSTVSTAIEAVTSAVSAEPEIRSSLVARCSAAMPTASPTVVNR